MARILICDDSLSTCLKIRDILEKAGHEIIGEATNVEDVVEMYKKYVILKT